MYATILWATDGSHEADVALQEALRLLEPGGRLIAFHCDQRFIGSRASGIPIFPDEDDRRRRVSEQVDQLRDEGINAELVIECTTRDAGAEVAAAAENEHVDAIVCGTRGLHGIVGFLAGSTASRVARHATVPVMVVPVDTPAHPDRNVAVEGAAV